MGNPVIGNLIGVDLVAPPYNRYLFEIDPPAGEIRLASMLVHDVRDDTWSWGAIMIDHAFFMRIPFKTDNLENVKVAPVGFPSY